MTVLKGEGKVPIIFNSTSISAGAVTHTAYLARPDLKGEWPTVVVLPSEWGLTGAAKDITRRLARQGFVAVCPDVYAGDGPVRTASKAEALAAFENMSRRRLRRDLDDLVDFIANPSGFWSSAEDGFGAVGIGSGGRCAVDLATRHHGTPLAIIGAPLRSQATDPPGDDDLRGTGQPGAGTGEGAQESLAIDLLAAVSGPIIGLFGREDEHVPVDDIMAARAAVPHAEWILYSDVGADFLDDYLEGFNAAASADVVERLAHFFEKNLPQVR